MTEFHQLRIRLSVDEFDALQLRSENERISMNEVMRRAFRAYCGGHDMLSQDEIKIVRDFINSQ